MIGALRLGLPSLAPHPGVALAPPFSVALPPNPHFRLARKDQRGYHAPLISLAACVRPDISKGRGCASFESAPAPYGAPANGTVEDGLTRGLIARVHSVSFLTLQKENLARPLRARRRPPRIIGQTVFCRLFTGPRQERVLQRLLRTYPYSSVLIRTPTSVRVRTVACAPAARRTSGVFPPPLKIRPGRYFRTNQSWQRESHGR